MFQRASFQALCFLPTKIIYSLELNLKLNRIFLAGYVEEIISFNESRSNVESIAFDWTSDNIYWTDTGLKTIGVAKASAFSSMAHMKVSRVLITEHLGNPRAIALHPVAGYVY